MKSAKMRILVSVIIVCMILAISNISRAYSVNGSLSTSDRLIPGENVSITFSISDINMAEGVGGISVSKISYDNNVFEQVTKTSFTASGDWEVAGYSTSSQVLTLKNDTKSQSNTTVVTLTLKVKEGATATSSVVKFENITATSGLTTGDIPVGTKTVTLHSDAEAQYGSITEPTPDPGSGSGAGTNSPAADPAVEPGKNTPDTKQISASKADRKILNAGDGITIILTAVGIAVFAVAIVGFVKYTKNKDIK